MKEGQAKEAVIYLRVSTEEQAIGPFNLANQEERCRIYCKEFELKVVEVFVDPGLSGRSAASRPAFQRMLAFCKANRDRIGHVVVQDLSRFARDAKDQADAIFELEKSGVRVRSDYERNVDETAAGKLAGNMLAAFNQYFSDALSEKMKDRMRASAASGRFPRRAPIGYQNVGGKVGPNIVPDPERAPLIRRAFELMATGLYKKSQVLDIVTNEGLLTPRGRPLSPQTLMAVMRNPLYAGWITLRSDKSFEPVRGLHEPIVSQETFDRVQSILEGRKPVVAPKRKLNPSLPLKCFVKCHICGTPLTGGFVKGRTKKYGRYWCRKKGCRAVKLSKEKLDSEFLLFLGRLDIDPEAASQFPRIAAKVWARRESDTQRDIKRLNSRLEEQKDLKRKLLRAKLVGDVVQADYERANAEFDREVESLEEQIRTKNAEGMTLEKFIRFAELSLVDLGAIWTVASPENRARVQNLLFEDGLDYSPKHGILNRSKRSVFSVLEGLKHPNQLLASPTGFEPVLSP